MFIPEPRSNKKTKKEGEKLVALAFFVAINLKKMVNYFIIYSTKYRKKSEPFDKELK
jgi:hypothetical protein